LLSLLHEQGNPEAQLALLERLLDDDDTTSRAAFRMPESRGKDVERRAECLYHYSHAGGEA
ncbi:MAG: hypothetical protein P8Y85_08920, partial [Nitrospirota bacterium]